MSFELKPQLSGKVWLKIVPTVLQKANRKPVSKRAPVRINSLNEHSCLFYF